MCKTWKDIKLVCYIDSLSNYTILYSILVQNPLLNHACQTFGNHTNRVYLNHTKLPSLKIQALEKPGKLYICILNTEVIALAEKLLSWTSTSTYVFHEYHCLWKYSSKNFLLSFFLTTYLFFDKRQLTHSQTKKVFEGSVR